jgi:prepilin-type N-terminal cleavage/methylation domain-containing protein
MSSGSRSICLSCHYPGTSGCRVLRVLPGSQHPQGFTLLEVIIVLTILTFAISMVVPRIGAGWKRMEEREFVQDLLHTLKRGRIRALSSGEITLFRIRGAERAYGLDLPPSQFIPEDVDIYADNLEKDIRTGDRIITFYPDGSIAGSDIKIVFSRQRAYLIVINPIAGTIRLTRM